MPPGMLRGNVEHQDKVGRVTGRAQNAASGTRLIHGALIDGARLKLVRLARPQPDHRQRVVEDLGQRLVEQHRLSIPASALYEQTLYQASPPQPARNRQTDVHSTVASTAAGVFRVAWRHNPTPPS